ncbi:hypothetical protein R6Q59_036403 [Mikania micrantha]
MGGHGGHDEPAYLHSKHMYNLDRMKNQKLTMTLGVFTAFSIGVGVPIYAVIFQQKKTASGYILVGALPIGPLRGRRPLDPVLFGALLPEALILAKRVLS